MTKLIGVKSVVCACGERMTRLGGHFGGKINSTTFQCLVCKQVVNILFPLELEH